MKFEPKTPPRVFLVGNSRKFEMRDCGSVRLDPDEQLTFLTPSGAEFDITRKDWGYYATPSLNSRLLSFGLRGVMVKNPIGRYFVLLVERGKEESFFTYVNDENLQVICWMDGSEALERLERALEMRR